MLSITAIMLGATLGTTTPGGWSFGLTQAHLILQSRMMAQFGTITTYSLQALKTITSTKIARCL